MRRVSRLGDAAQFLFEIMTGLAGAEPARRVVRVDPRDARTQRRDRRRV